MSFFATASTDVLAIIHSYRAQLEQWDEFVQHFLQRLLECFKRVSCWHPYPFRTFEKAYRHCRDLIYDAAQANYHWVWPPDARADFERRLARLGKPQCRQFIADELDALCTKQPPVTIAEELVNRALTFRGPGFRAYLRAHDKSKSDDDWNCALNIAWNPHWVGVVCASRNKIILETFKQLVWEELEGVMARRFVCPVRGACRPSPENHPSRHVMSPR